MEIKWGVPSHRTKLYFLYLNYMAVIRSSLKNMGIEINNKKQVNQWAIPHIIYFRYVPTARL